MCKLAISNNAAFRQGLHCLFRQKISSDKMYNFFFNYNLKPLDKYNVYCQSRKKSISKQRVNNNYSQLLNLSLSHNCVLYVLVKD